MIEIRGFPARSGPLDLDITSGDVVLLQGGNGSGKTSLLRSLAGLDAPLHPPRVLIQGRDPRALDAHDLAPLVRWAPQDARDALVGLTVAGEFRLRDAPLPHELHAQAAQDVATLSSGESRRLALAVAREGDAPVLLLDEPAEGLDAPSRERLRHLVREACARGAAVVAADHAALLDDLATRRVPLDGGLPDPLVEDDAIHLDRPRDAPVVLRAAATQVQRGKRALHLPALELAAGLHALVGPNGSGKTTLLTRLAGLDDARDVLVDDARASPGRNVRAMPPRARDMLLAARVEDELRGAEPDIVDALVPLGLRARHPLALSGGEQQRVALARTLGTPARVYALDEPEAHLDATGRRALVAVLARRIDEGACIVAATHDPALQRLAHTTTRMEMSA